MPDGFCHSGIILIENLLLRIMRFSLKTYTTLQLKSIHKKRTPGECLKKRGNKSDRSYNQRSQLNFHRF